MMKVFKISLLAFCLFTKDFIQASENKDYMAQYHEALKAFDQSQGYDQAQDLEKLHQEKTKKIKTKVAKKALDIKQGITAVRKKFDNISKTDWFEQYGAQVAKWLWSRQTLRDRFSNSDLEEQNAIIENIVTVLNNDPKMKHKIPLISMDENIVLEIEKALIGYDLKAAQQEKREEKDHTQEPGKEDQRKEVEPEEKENETADEYEGSNAGESFSESSEQHEYKLPEELLPLFMKNQVSIVTTQVLQQLKFDNNETVYDSLSIESLSPKDLSELLGYLQGSLWIAQAKTQKSTESTGSGTEVEPSQGSDQTGDEVISDDTSKKVVLNALNIAQNAMKANRG